MKYLLEQETEKKTPQSKPIPGREKQMERNNAGRVRLLSADMWTRLDRWLILGSDGRSYYVEESDLTKMNVVIVRACSIKATDGIRTIETIKQISLAGRAPKNDPALYALALAASTKDQKTVIARRSLPFRLSRAPERICSRSPRSSTRCAVGARRFGARWPTGTCTRRPTSWPIR